VGILVSHWFNRTSVTCLLQQLLQILSHMGLLENLNEAAGNIIEMSLGSPWRRDTSSLKVDICFLAAVKLETI